MADTDVIKRSVTANDQGKAEWRGNVFHFILPALQSWDTGLPAYWSFQRDMHLRYSIFREEQWANAVHIARTKMSSLTAELKGNRIQNWKDLWDLVDNGQSPTAFLEKQVSDYLLCDNGEFIEVVHATLGAGSRILGLMHLDSNRCTRTGDPDIPVIYRDRLGVEHEMKSHQVMALADSPDSADTFYGVGHCAASRAWPAIQRLSAINTYIYEKVSGRRPLALYIVNSNVNEEQIRDAIETAAQDRSSKGYTHYMGAVIIPILDPNAKPDIATIPLAELPDGFDIKEERNRADLTYANSIGIDPQEINPDLIASRALGTASQARVLEEKESGKGLASWRKKFPWMLNEYVFPTRVTYAFAENDIRDQQNQANVSSTRASTRATQIASGEITKEQALQIAVDAGDVPREFLPATGDQTPVETVDDTERTQEELLANEPVAPTASAVPEQQGTTSQDIAQALRNKAAYPPALQKVLDEATRAIDTATADLQSGKLTVDAWQAQVDGILQEFHRKAYEAGAKTSDLNDAQKRLIDLQVQDQREYLDNFAGDIRNSKEWQPEWNGRASMYAQSVGASYWNGRTKDVALPAQPQDGTTQCLTNCKCRWVLKAVDAEAGDYDAFWTLGAADHCQTCLERADQWNPLKIRGGVTQLS